MEDEDGFDFEWDIKQPNGLNITENKLFDAMKKIGLKPEPQYSISQMKVDFAFPEERIAIEVNGPHHYTEEVKLKDKKRYFVLKHNNWKVKTFSAKRVYYYPEDVAKEIKVLLNYPEKQEIISYNKETYSEELIEELPDYNTAKKDNKVLKILIAIIALIVGSIFLGFFKAMAIVLFAYGIFKAIEEEEFVMGFPYWLGAGACMVLNAVVQLFK